MILPIQNLYYMLAYAFRTLREGPYRSMSAEEFQNTGDLLAEIMIRAMSIQIRQGIGHEYISKSDSLTLLRGKIDTYDSIRSLTYHKNQMVCTFDEFSMDFYLNRIIKTSALKLLKLDIPKEKKTKLRNLLIHYKDVGTINVQSINWKIRFTRNYRTYQMLMGISYLILQGLLQNEQPGNRKSRDFIDDQSMPRLFEKFLFEYFKKEHPTIKTRSPHIRWKVDDGFTDMLPTMKSDIVLTSSGKSLIIDAKYYSRTTNIFRETRSLHSGNLYQIYTYVKNYEAQSHDIVSGMLLYAKTDESIELNHNYQMGGNLIMVRTLDLECHFTEIAKQIDEIVYEQFV